MSSKISVAAALLILPFGAYADSTAVTRTVPIPGNSVTSGGQATSAVKAFALPSNVCTSDNSNCLTRNSSLAPGDVGLFGGAWTMQFRGQSKTVGSVTATIDSEGGITITNNGATVLKQSAVGGYTPVAFSYLANGDYCGAARATIYFGPDKASEVNYGKTPTSWGSWTAVDSSGVNNCGGA